jgi:hypothetical protein
MWSHYREYLKDEINELRTDNKNIRDLYIWRSEFEKGYQLRSKLVKDENGDLLADFHILNRWKNYISQLLNMHSISNFRNIEIQLSH